MLRIKRIILKNYRQFRDVEINFAKSSKYDIYVIKALMGTGKTNLLNAVNWCLYGDEPYLSKQSQQLPILNLKTITEAKKGEDICVKVDIIVEGEGYEYIRFVREEYYRIYDLNKLPKKQDTLFKVYFSLNGENIEVLTKEVAQNWVERFVPKRVRDFFFFDGERLDKYFREATGQNIRKAVFDISQIDLLERVRGNLNTLLKEIRKEASKSNPNTERIEAELDKKENLLEEIERQIDEIKNQIKIAKGNVKEYEENLKGLPNIEELEEKRKNLVEKRKRYEEMKQLKIDEKRRLLYEYSKILMCWNTIKRAIDIIENKKEAKELPPTIDKSLLENALKANTCTICGRPLTVDIVKKIKDLLREIEISSEVAQELLFMENPLVQYVEKLKKFDSKIGKITQEINYHESELRDIESELSEIDRKLRGYNIDKIREWNEQRRKFEHIISENQEQLGFLKAEGGRLMSDIQKLKAEYEKEIKKVEKVKKLNEMVQFCDKAINILNRSKNNIMTEIRKNIEAETKKLFFDFIWKKESFKDVDIDDDYNINLISSLGFECIGSIGGGERAVLTLAFTLALHEISGFDSPIIVDRPLTNVSGIARKNVIEILTETSKEKQLIILLTPNDYLEDISSILDENASARFELKLSEDEKEVRLEVL